MSFTIAGMCVQASLQEVSLTFWTLNCCMRALSLLCTSANLYLYLLRFTDSAAYTAGVSSLSVKRNTRGVPMSGLMNCCMVLSVTLVTNDGKASSAKLLQLAPVYLACTTHKDHVTSCHRVI